MLLRAFLWLIFVLDFGHACFGESSSVFAWVLAGLVTEGAAKRSGRFVATAEGDFADGQLRVAEKRSGVEELLLSEVAPEGDAGGAFELFA